MIKNPKILVVGLGYVGLPLCIELKKNFSNTSGYDYNKIVINNLIKYGNHNNILNKIDTPLAKNMSFSSNINDFKKYNIFIITVPTPIHKNKKPNFKYVLNAMSMIARIIKPKDIIILESTVYPGFSDDQIFPYFKKNHNLTVNKDYFYGYSPERINPSDKINKINNINKIISSENDYTLKVMKYLYSKVVNKAKLHITKSVKVAEAAKVIENTQRDLNISLMNELSIICNKLNIDTSEVIDAASTKWNFHRYKPGLVGGHCIGVDPYYLAYKSKDLGHFPDVILSGRKINDNLVIEIIKLIREKLKLKGIKKINKILYLGLTFKENCNDFRNSGSIKLLELVKQKFKKSKIFINDPYIKFLNDDVFQKSNYEEISLSEITRKKYELIIIAVAHKKYESNLLKNFIKKNIRNNVIIDLNALFSKSLSDYRL
jgi:UDP-N-acetyl-D-galactosamine dehydrogenase